MKIIKIKLKKRANVGGAAAACALTLAAALALSACTAPRAWDLNKAQTAHEKTQSSQLNGAGMSIGDAATRLLESDYAAFSDASAASAVPAQDSSASAAPAASAETGAEGAQGSASNANASAAASPASSAESYTDDESIPGQGTRPVPESEAVMEISGQYVSKQYLEFRAALYAVAQSGSDPLKAAEDLIKKQTVEWSFAQEHGILPTDDEVMTYCETMRSDAESDIESRENMLVVVQNMGLNESEYFRVFQPRYEVPFILVSENISRYCSENGVEQPDASEAQVNVKDGQYIQELKEKYQKTSK